MIAIGIRKEVTEFVRTCETLLSSALLSPKLTKEECALIAEYVRYLSGDKTPWRRYLTCHESEQAKPLVRREADGSPDRGPDSDP